MQKPVVAKAMIERGIEQAEQYIDKVAATAKAECPNQPVENIRMTLVRGDCPCRCALRLLNEAE